MSSYPSYSRYWDSITENSSERFIFLEKIGNKEELIAELKGLGNNYSDIVTDLENKEKKIGKYKRTYYWILDDDGFT